MEKLNKVFKKKQKQYKTLSVLEQKIVNILISYESIDFESNYKVGPYFVDIAFPKHKVALEIDGHAYHSTEEQRARDELRQEYLEQVKGWKIERVAGWFCHRYPEVSVGKVLRHVPEAQDHHLFKRACALAKSWYVSDLINEGKRDRVNRILEEARA